MSTGGLRREGSSNVTVLADRASAPGLHVAIIMDGNGRWATQRGQDRSAGHLAGADAVRRTVEAAPQCGIEILTLYAFSSDNWQRPPQEVRTLMKLLRRYLLTESNRCAKEGVRLEVIGRRDRLTPALRTVIASAEALTARGKRLRLRIAVDYSARDAILAAAQHLRKQPNGAPPSREEFARLLGFAERPVPDVDLLLRTGGEQRLSDFLLWECAYAELMFLPVMWPEFQGRDLEEAVREFGLRERRYGRVAPEFLAAELPSLAAGAARS
jgi:undecaprenyl diphosphate synthase